jgi:cytidylate kinase
VDRDGLQRFTARVITEAARAGNCVIVGRSSQCVLRHDPAALHVLVYAPQQEKLDRMSMRHSSERDLPALLHRMDAERSRYTRDYYGCDWSDRRLYQLCVNSTLGIGACAALIAGVVRQSQSVEAESDRQVSV